ncbi:hypothetical protein SPRG_18992 [Saprolegnia parasitica CBS 223.65]|uniref:Uncharacterized protein n=1 Tax=Saprolegnia parasitica (strain CBS 223.65) TaxID=695850 RepID=A0A067D5Y4_SAPPC|nr:hypothetical protein SPRG_18992 [Saprolegnia parasitica CBS 223.65]KDO34106.1 hypothetical protein SPRG_18992 [Saprolegnia parasitica CBS 223.65]|eukprot:XP_012195196.1 hypothetical protein SPRG_18992 [Saprolegnia parasitica CBS 223.65]
MQALRDDADRLQAQHNMALSAATAETNRVRADVQRLQRTVEELQTSNFDFKKFVQTITEEDDAIRDQLEAMLATGLGVLRYSNVGVACLKLGATLERVVYALHEKMAAPRSCATADDDRANVLTTEVRMREVQLDALRNEVDELHIGFRTMEKLAADRLDALEQLRSELDQANAQAAARSDAQRHITASLQQEIACHIESIAQLQAEKRSALTTSATEIESYEDVLKEEFAVMRKAYELKAKQAQEQLEAQEKNHFKQLHELVRKHKEDRVLEEIRTKKIQHELQILKEKYIHAASGITSAAISIKDPLGGASSNVGT